MRLHLIETLAVLVVCHLHYASTCASRGKKGSKNPPDDSNNKQPPPNNDAVKNMLGDNVKQTPYDNSGYDGKNGQANSPDDLKCDFEGNCCWKNTKPPFDTMEWNKASGAPDSDKLSKNFGTSTAPSGNFLIIASDKPAGSSDKGEFESCAIACAGDSIKVTLKHWTSQGVKLEVCQIAKSDPNTLLNCQPVPSASPGPDTVTLPPGSDIILTIVASNFVADGGSVAMIDDISVDYPPCTSPTPAPTTTAAAAPSPAATPAPTQPPPPNNDEAKKLCCGFESGPCNWSRGSGPSKPPSKGTTQDWQKAGPERFKNPATGVPPSPDKAFMAAYMKGGDSAYTECQSNFDQERTIKFEEYKATQDMSLKACCDTEQGCTYDTGNKVEKTDFRQWYQGSIKCPAGTKKVIFYAENTGSQEGGVGIDQVQVFDANGNQIC
jgi:hypothetical protein